MKLYLIANLEKDRLNILFHIVKFLRFLKISFDEKFLLFIKTSKSLNNRITIYRQSSISLIFFIKFTQCHSILNTSFYILVVAVYNSFTLQILFIKQLALSSSLFGGDLKKNIRIQYRMKSHKILDLIGNTPLVESTNLVQNKNVKLLLKLEGNNPGGSVKDRAAYNMIKSALERGEIKQGDKLIEATSGNTGIALAMIAQLFNLEIELILPEDSTKERTQTMRAYGATVILTPASTGIIGSRDYADKKVAEGGYIMLNQFANDDNWKAHYKTTGPEIWNDTEGTVTHFVSAMGTTGTIIGTSAYLKEKNSNIQILGAQPSDGSQIPGIRKWPQEYLPKIFDASKVDTIIEVSEKEAREMTKRLALEEGVFAGMSSGGSVAAAIKIANTLESGVIVAIICDRGDRYLSSDLFE